MQPSHSERLADEGAARVSDVALEDRRLGQSRQPLADAPGPELAHAVDQALALDPRDRWKTADEMRQGLVDGARGRGAEPTEATRAIALGTDATSVVPRGDTEDFGAQREAVVRRLRGLAS